MKHFQVEVVEVQHLRKMYIVEAASNSQALEKAARGETVEEWTLRNEGVQHRFTQSAAETVIT
jgi:hypothetical protein